MTRKTGRPASDSRIQAGNYHRVREDVGGISDGQFNQSTNVLCTRANSDAERLRIRLQGGMHDAKHVLFGAPKWVPVPRYYCKPSRSERRIPQRNLLRPCSSEDSRTTPRQCVEIVCVSYLRCGMPRNALKPGFCFSTHGWKSTTVNCSRNRNEATLISI